MTLDAIGLEVMAHWFAGIADEMGSVLVASALSPNVRERRDSSAALFSADGEMVAQAAHIPVHLGAMPEAVAAVRNLAPEPGDTFVLNDPFTGGTHLPDITMVHAVELEGRVGAFAVVRAHHSDVGGSVPGSMPPQSTEIFQEGLVLPPVRWASGGKVDQGLEDLLMANVRTPEICRGDLAAQLAACELGARRYRELVAHHGLGYIGDAQRELLDYAERRTVAALSERVKVGHYTAEDWLEGDGSTDQDLVIRVAVRVSARSFFVDFEGTAAAARGNVNCPISVTRSAVLFVLRCLIDPDIPTNGGVHRVARVRAPAGTLVNALRPSAVAAGNVETSQRIADALFSALADAAEVPAQGQGTMNNVVIGGSGWTYYETIGGGQGASPFRDGPSGVHVGMSNTRNTPIEVIEMDYPMRIRAYALRRGSGGGGRYRGGDGVVREYEALEEMQVSLLTERRRHPARGVRGGASGVPGVNSLNGRALGAKVGVVLGAGDCLRIETPGGGGWGELA